MRTIFLDEAGNTPNWRTEATLADQPFYVLSAVSLPTEVIPELYRNIRSLIEKIDVVDILNANNLGQGVEIKARDITRGRGYWKNYPAKRNFIRSLMVDCVRLHGGVAFVSVIDKRKLHEKYTNADDPKDLALQYLYERLDRHLNDEDDYGICMFDQQKFSDDDLHGSLMGLNAHGSSIHYYSKAFGRPIIKPQSFNRITDHMSGISEGSIGLQIADFYASLTYAWHRDGCPDTDEQNWWWILDNSLAKCPIRGTGGYGYKIFPEEHHM